MVIKKLLCAAAFTGLSIVPAAAADDAMDTAVIEALTEVPVKDMVERAGYTAAQKPLMEDHLRELLSYETMRPRVAKAIIRNTPDEMRSDPEAAPLLVKNYTAAAMHELIRKGAIPFLSVDELRQYRAMQRQLLSKMDGRDCVEHVIWEDAQTKSAPERLAAEIAALDGEPEEFLKEWLRLNRQAFAVAAQGGPKELDTWTDELGAKFNAAKEAHQNVFSNLVDAQPRSEHLVEGYVEYHSAPAEDVCEVMQLRLDAALSVEDDLRLYAILPVFGD